MKDAGVTVYRCRWCGRRVRGVFGWFHKPERCTHRPPLISELRLPDLTDEEADAFFEAINER